MKLPNFESAVVLEAKIKDYLLSETHSDGKEKAVFFRSFGFSLEAWQDLAKAFLQHAAEHEITKVVESVHGVKYIIEGSLVTPDRRNPVIRVVWLLENDEMLPRLITAYPM